MIDTSALSELEGPSDDKLKGVREIAQRLVNLEDEVAQLEAQLKVKKETLQKTRIEHLPEAMKEVGLRKFTLESGEEIDVSPDLNVWIKNADQPSVFDWMRANGHGSIIKNEFKIPLGKGEEQRAQELQALLEQSDFDYSNKAAIHPGTLKAWTREQLREGNELPDTINVFEFEAAKVKRPKAGA